MPLICRDLQRLVKGYLSDDVRHSTNAERPGFTMMSEWTVGKTFDQIFAEHRNNTELFLRAFASNVD